MDWEWERIGNFGSLCERDRFMAWMRKQIKDGMAEEIDSPAGFDAGDRWFRHISPPARSGVWFRTRTHMGQASGLLMWVTGPHKPEAASVGGLFRYGLFGGVVGGPIATGPASHSVAQRHQLGRDARDLALISSASSVHATASSTQGSSKAPPGSSAMWRQ